MTPQHQPSAAARRLAPAARPIIPPITPVTAEPSAWPAPTSDTLREQVTRELARYYSDLSARDWGAFADHFWPGATLSTIWTPPGEAGPRIETTTVPEFVRNAPHGADSKSVFEERMIDLVVTGYANLAQAWVRYEARFGEPGDVAEWRGVDAVILLKYDGLWRIMSLSYTDQNESSASIRCASSGAVITDTLERGRARTCVRAL